MKTTANPLRLFSELLAIAGLIELALALAAARLAYREPTLTQELLHAALLVGLVSPFAVWRGLAFARRTGDARSDLPTGQTRTALALASAAVLLGLVLTIAVGHAMQKTIWANARVHFERQVELVEAEIQRRFLQPVYGLNGARGMYAAGHPIGRDAFRAYVESRDLPREFPGVRGFGFIERVMRADLEPFVAGVRADAAPFFEVRTSGDALDLYVIKFIEPLQDNRAALGLDVGAEPVRRQAVERAILTGQFTLSAPIALVQDDRQRPGFVFLVPVFRPGTQRSSVAPREAALVGLLYSPIVAAEILSGAASISSGQIEFSLFDGAVAQPQYRVFGTEKPRAPGDEADATFAAARTLNIGGRSFALAATSSTTFDAQIDRRTPMLIRVGGTVMSALLAFSIWLLATGRARAQAVAEGMTADLDRLAQVVRHTSNSVVITDRDRKITWVNGGFTRIYGYSLEEAVGRTPQQLLGSGQTDPVAYQAMDAAAAAETSCRVEVVNRAKDGRTYWIELEVQPRRDASGALIGFMQIGLDISAQKVAQQRLADALQALTRERERLDRIVEGTNVGTWEWNVQTGEVRCNERWAGMIGHTLTALSPFTLQAWRKLLHPEDLKRSRALVLQHFRGQRDYYECEVRMRHREGHWVWLLVRGRVSARAADGRPIWMTGIQMDISLRKRAEDQLRASQAFLQRAERIAGVGSWEVDLRTNTITWSDQTYRIYGREPGSPLTMQLALEHYATAERELIAQLARDCIERRAPWDLELPATTASGRPIWIRSVGSAEIDDGQPVRLVGTLQDVTETRAIREELRRSNSVLQSILDNLPCGLSVFDSELKLVAHNRQFRDLMDLPDALFAGAATRLEDIYRYEVARGAAREALPIEEQVARLVERARHPARLPFEWQRHDGKPIEILRAPMPDGGVVTTYIDISERKEVERVKREFISTVSHELRTPLTSIHGSLSLLASGAAGELAADVQELIALSLRSSERLVRLVSDVLDVEKIESRMMSYTMVAQPLAPLIDQAIDATRHYAEQYGVRLEFETRIEEATVAVDADRIVQVLVNLLSNAAKFSERGQSVSVRMAVAGDTLRVSVVDRGQGIPERFRAHIFERFSQVDSSDRRQKGGTGLGLNICRSIVEQHRGRIDFVSAPGAGSEFYFELPLVPGR